MKQQVVPGLAPSCVSQVYSPGIPMSGDSSVVDDTKDVTTGDSAVTMSNLELLGNVAFAMAQSDGIDDGTGQQAVMSTDADNFALADNSGQMPGSQVFYIVATGDGDTPQSYAEMLQQTVEVSAAAAGENVTDGECTQGISGITNTYFSALPDNYDTLCSVGAVQYSVCDAVSGADEYIDLNVASSCMQDELAGSEPSAAAGNNVISAGSSIIHTVDMSLDTISLSMLTNAVTS